MILKYIIKYKIYMCCPELTLISPHANRMHSCNRQFILYTTGLHFWIHWVACYQNCKKTHKYPIFYVVQRQTTRFYETFSRTGVTSEAGEPFLSSSVQRRIQSMTMWHNEPGTAFCSLSQHWLGYHIVLTTYSLLVAIRTRCCLSKAFCSLPRTTFQHDSHNKEWLYTSAESPTTFW